jgi:hypothetical protein
MSALLAPQPNGLATATTQMTIAPSVLWDTLSQDAVIC